MNFEGHEIALGITGSIAAYKACDLVRELYRKGAKQVHCLLTPAAKEFISPLTLQGLSKNPVYTHELDITPEGIPVHIDLAQRCAAMLIYPASMNSLAQLAHGLGQDLVSTTALTFTGKPILLAPAMNTRMWENPATQRNLSLLRQTPDIEIIAPYPGWLACGETGDGHLADQQSTLLALYRAMHPDKHAYQGIRALVSAGGTREPIDPVRFITNRSSGKMGFALADELWAMGADVTLVTTDATLNRPYPVLYADTVVSMYDCLNHSFDQADLLLMAAAVSDYRVLAPSVEKVKKVPSGETYTLDLTPSIDVLSTLAQQKRPHQTIVGFAAESENLAEAAQSKMSRKGLDAIIANDISRADIGFSSDENEVTLFIENQTPIALGKQPKWSISRQVLRQLQETVQKKKRVSCIETLSPI